MNKIRILLIAVILLGKASVAQAEDRKLGVTLDVTYMTKLMDKGREYYGSKGGLLTSIDVDLFSTGFGVEIGHRQATSSGYVNKERLDYKVNYRSRLFEGETYATKYKLNWLYHQHPDQPRNAGNTQEWQLAFSWPEVLPGGLVPSYLACYVYPAGSNYDNRNCAGWWHLFGLGYDLDVPELPGPLHLSSEVAYTDGFGGAAHDWSHITFGVSTGLKITDNLSFVPTIYHQVSMDDSVCKRDVTYCMLSMKYKF